LATGQALVTTAGNQLVGESLYLGKPVLALPEPGNFEQHLNGHLLQRLGSGISAPAERLNAEVVLSFLSRLDTFRARIDRSRLCGNPVVQSILDGYLGSGAATMDALVAA
jgi:UDP:flavonoid glycosyltransferase YjiC (YdhE family)